MIQVGQDGADPQTLAWGLQLRGLVECRTNALDQAGTYLRRAIELFNAIPAYPSAAETMGYLGHSQLRRGQLKEALTTLEECRRLIRSRGLRGHEVTAACNSLAEAYLVSAERGDVPLKAESLRKARHACRVAL